MKVIKEQKIDIRIEAKQKERLKEMAAKRDLSVSEFVRTLIEDAIQKEGK